MGREDGLHVVCCLVLLPDPAVLGGCKCIDRHIHLRRVHGDALKLIHQRQHEEVEGGGTDPLRHSAGHVEAPSTITGVPLPGVVTIELRVGDAGTDAANHEEDRGHHRQAESNMGHGEAVDQRVRLVRTHGLNPEIRCSKAKRYESSCYMHKKYIRLLEICDDGYAKSRE